MSDRIKVAIRVRPLNAREQPYGSSWDFDSNTITPFSLETGRPVGTTYAFDNIFGLDSNTNDVYAATASELVQSAMEGINGTIFAYGQTSSGKTFTMKGTYDKPGIIPLAIQHIFKYIENTPDREFLLRVSYLEIYKEVITDLLMPGNTNLAVHEDIKRGVFVGKLKEEIVTSYDQVLELMAGGEVHRHVGTTNMNEYSSRSHTVFRMVIESKERYTEKEIATHAANGSRKSAGAETKAVKVSVLNLVDLAGSERAAQTGAEGERLKEGGHINKSLLTLQRVIAALSEGQASHVPFRESKLTRILQPALGGNARTAIICAMTPAALHVEESLGTLKFANSAKNIACKPKVNEVLDDKTLIKRYEKQIESLKKELDSLKSEKTEATTLMASPSVAIDFPTSQPASDVNTPTKLTSEEIVQRDTELLALLKGGIISARKMKSTSATKARQLRRQTWCPPSALGGGSAVLDDPTEQLIFSPIAKAAVPRMRDSLVDDLLNPSFALDLTDGGDPFSESSTSSVNGNPRRSNSGLVDSSALVMELKHKIARLEDELAQSLQDAEIARAGESHAVEQVKTIEDALRKEINELNANILNSQKIIEEKVEIIAFTEKKLADKEQEQQQSAVPPAGISNEEKEQLEQQIAALQDQLKEEQDMSEMLEKQFVDETLELEKNYQEQVEALTAEREGFAAQIDELKQKSDADLVAVNQAKEQVELFKASVEAAQAKSKIAEEEASKLRVELESAAKRASESEKELEYKQLEIEKLTWDLEIRENDAKDLEILREQVAQLQGQIDVSASIAAEIEALRVENMELKAKIDQSPLISLEEIESLRGELDQVKTAYQASMERCSEFEKENTELVHTLTETSSMIDDLKAQIATLEDAAVVAAAAQGNAAESFANLQAEHAQVCAKVQELHTIAAAAGKSAETGKQLMRAENEVLQLRTQLNSITEKHEQLQEKYSEVVAQISKLRTEQEAVSGSEKQLSAIKVAQENTAAEHQRAIEKLQAALREQQDQSAHKSSEHKQALGAIEEKLKSLQSHNALLTAELTAAKEHEEAARQEADTLRSRSRQLEQESNSMSSTAYKSDNDAQAMKKKISQLQQTLDLTNQTMAKLERQIKEVEEERKSADQRANSLQRQIDDAAAAQAKAQQNQRSNANGAYLEAQLDEIKRKFQQEKTALESEVARLRPLASNAASLSNEVFDLQKANEKIMKEKKELMVDASEVAAKLKRLQNTFNELEMQLDSANHKIHQQESLIATLEEAEQKVRGEMKRQREEWDIHDATFRKERLALNSQLEDKESAIRQLKAENETLDRELTNYSTQMDGYKSHHEEFAHQYEVVAAEKREAEQKRNEAIAELTIIQGELNQVANQSKLLRSRYESETVSLRNEIAQLKKDMKATSNDKKSIEKERTAHTKELEKMQVKVDKAEEKSKQIAQEKSSLVQEKAAQERELASLRSSLTTLQKQVEKAENNYKSSEQRTKDAEGRVQKAETELKELSRTYNNVASQLDGAVLDSNKAKQELEQLRVIFDKTKQHFDATRDELAESQEELERTRFDLHQAQSAYTAAQAHIAQITTELTNSMEQLEELQVRMTEVTAQFTAKSEEAAQLASELADKTDKLDALQTQLAHVTSTNEQSSARLGQLDSQLDALTQEKTALVVRQQELQTALERLQQQHEQLQIETSARIGSLEKEFTEVSGSKQALEEQLSKLNEDLVDMSFREEETKAAYDSVKADFDQLSAAKSELDASVAQLQADITKTSATLNETEQQRASLAELIQKREAELSENEAKYDQLRSSSSTASSQWQQREAELAAKIQTLTSDLSTRMESFATLEQSLKDQLETAYDEIKSKTNIVNQQSQQLEEIRAQVADLDNKAVEYSELVTEADEELRRQEAIIAQKDADIRTLQEQIQQLVTQRQQETTAAQALLEEHKKEIVQVSKVASRVESLEIQLSAKTQHIAQIEEYLSQKDASLTDARAELQQFYLLKDNASAQIQRLNSAVREREEMLATIKKEFEAVVSQSKEATAQSNKKIQEFAQQLLIAQNEKALQTKKLQETIEIAQSLEEEKMAELKKAKEAERTIQKLQAEKAEESKKAQEASLLIQKLESQKSSEAEMATLLAKVAQLEEARNQAVSQLAEATSSVEELQQHYEGEIQTLNRAFDDQKQAVKGDREKLESTAKELAETRNKLNGYKKILAKVEHVPEVKTVLAKLTRSGSSSASSSSENPAAKKLPTAPSQAQPLKPIVNNTSATNL